MARFLFTMMAANDLGLPARMVPIARALADRGHDVAVFNPAPAPARLIDDAGLMNLPMPSRPMPVPAFGYELAALSAAWDVEHMFGIMYADAGYARADTDYHLELIRGFAPDVVVDSFGLPTCLAARILHIPLASVLQGNFHPASDGFLWWKGERPAGLPSAVTAINGVAEAYGIAPVARCVELLAGDLSLIVGTPETDPLPAGAAAIYIGPIIWQRASATLPPWLTALSRDRPVIWVYSGTPRYGSARTPFDSIVVIRAAMAALGDAPAHVVLTTGYQELPGELGALPSNFHHAAFLPAGATALRSDLMVHHGGHGSVMTGLSAGTPAVMIPTYTERESNARRVVALGAGEMVKPTDGADGEKHIDVAEFGAKLRRVLEQPGYRQTARRISASIGNFGGVREAADRIERLAGG
jgi:UDP:flavonoid glycosyltransferase YjiC (YdhE family)